MMNLNHLRDDRLQLLDKCPFKNMSLWYLFYPQARVTEFLLTFFGLKLALQLLTQHLRVGLPAGGPHHLAKEPVG